MKKPNDKKQPNTKGSEETRNRKRNYKYLHVSKRVLEVPVHTDGCDIYQVEYVDNEFRRKPCSCLTKVKEWVAERNGKTYEPLRAPRKKLKMTRGQIRAADMVIENQIRKPGFQGAA